MIWSRLDFLPADLNYFPYILEDTYAALNIRQIPLFAIFESSWVPVLLSRKKTWKYYPVPTQTSGFQILLYNIVLQYHLKSIL